MDLDEFSELIGSASPPDRSVDELSSVVDGLELDEAIEFPAGLPGNEDKGMNSGFPV